MEKLKNIAQKLLFPPKIIIFLLTVASAAGLWYIFGNKMDSHPVAYAFYTVSFYTLCVVLAAVPSFCKRYKNKIYANCYANRYITDANLRIKLSLYNGTVFNLVYASLKLMAGVYFKSQWIVAVAVYYMVLFVIRFCLVANDRRSKSFKAAKDQLLYRWKSYRIAGVLMFLLNVAVSGMAIQMIWHNKGYSYPGYLIYAMAAYTFYRFTMAVINVIKFRKSHNPVYAAAKLMDLSVAFMSVFALQTAMFAAFGNGMSAVAQRLFNICTGSFVCISGLFIAVMMVINANNQILKLKTISK